MSGLFGCGSDVCNTRWDNIQAKEGAVLPLTGE